MEIIHIVSKFLREMLEDKLQAGAKSLFSFPLERPLHGCVLLLAGLNQRKGLCVLLQQKALNGVTEWSEAVVAFSKRGHLLLFMLLSYDAFNVVGSVV